MNSAKSNSPGFKLSLTAVALGLRESEIALDIYQSVEDWNLVENQVLQENLFQKNSAASSKRVLREVRQRLQSLSGESQEIFLESQTDDRKAILLIACCKCYAFLFAFIRSVLAEKVVVFDSQVTIQEFDAFWNQASADFPSLEEISESSRKKTRQVIFRILAEAGLVSSTKELRITPIPISSTIDRVLRIEGEIYREAFL